MLTMLRQRNCPIPGYIMNLQTDIAVQVHRELKWVSSDIGRFWPRWIVWTQR